MKRSAMIKNLLAAAFLLTVPTALFAQEKEKVKKDFQQIIITRTGDKDEKTVIEIQGDKVKVNGKDGTDNKDVKVHVNKLRGATVYTPRAGEGFSFNFDNDNAAFFKEDGNRAMLGVVTEGRDNGAEVLSVTKETAADKAGLKKGDIITRIDNKRIESSDDVTEAIREHKPADKVSITFLRDGKEQKTTAELGKWKGIQWNTVNVPRMRELTELREGFRMAPPEEPMIFNGNFFGRPRLGISVRDKDDGKGVEVLDVDAESNAGKAGIKEGDIITQIDDKSVNSADEVSKLMREKRDAASVRMQVLRDGKQQTVDVKFPKKLKTVDL